MTPEQFTYWLQGFMELENPCKINEEKTKIIKQHLDLVFKKESNSLPLAQRIEEKDRKKILVC